MLEIVRRIGKSLAVEPNTKTKHIYDVRCQDLNTSNTNTNTKSSCNYNHNYNYNDKCNHNSSAASEIKQSEK